MDEHIIRLYDINGIEAIQINGRWLDVLSYNDLALQADSLGLPNSLSHLPKATIYNRVIALVRETREESEEIVELIPCDCLICSKGIPKPLNTTMPITGTTKNSSINNSMLTTQAWQERLKIIMYILIQQQLKHAKELEKELSDRNIKKNSELKKVLSSKRQYIHTNEMSFYLETHKSILKFDLLEYWKAALVGKDFISGFEHFGIKGYWTLASMDDPYNDNYNYISTSNITPSPYKLKAFALNSVNKTLALPAPPPTSTSPIKSNNNNLAIVSTIPSSSSSSSSSSSPSPPLPPGYKRICGGITKHGKPCQKIGFCSFHMIRNDQSNELLLLEMNKYEESSSSSSNGDSNSDYSSNSDSENEEMNIDNNNSNNRKRKRKSNNKKSIIQPSIVAPSAKMYISEQTFKVRELEKRILDNFNFYRFIVKFESYGYRIAKEFSRFIALKVLCDETGDDQSTTILQPPKVVEEFWIQIILTSLEYNKLLEIIKIDKIRYDPDLSLDEIQIQRKRYENTIKLYKKYFRIEKFDTEIWNDDYLLL